MDDVKQKEAARQFVKKWTNKGQEDEDDRSYWLDILERILDVENATDHIEFQKKVTVDGSVKKIDAYIPETRVLIEQKSLGKALDKKGPQSDKQQLTAFEQADRYNGKLTFDERARWIVTSNFSEIWIYDMNEEKPQPTKLMLSDLPDNCYKLEFLINQEIKKISQEIKVSKEAGKIVGKLYDAFLNQYSDPDNKETLHHLNVLCVRLVFCLYAENSGLFGHYGLFHEYMEMFQIQHMRRALEELFEILDTPIKERRQHLADDDPKLAAFPYVNGGLFSERNIDIPPFTEEIRELLLDEASAGFNWSEISPTIFGAVFESTLNPETRRSGGMHYTSIKNIHKVIDPLFLNDLKKEFKEICDITVERTRNRKLQEFQKRLASLNFLDPACGSGNFLTEAYLSLRRLENAILKIRLHDQMSFGDEGISPIQVSLSQFYGIEINDFAVTVAKTALWIAESQMIKETEEIVLSHIPFLPLKSYANIIEGNALRIRWEDIVSKNKLSYIIGNPPFSGARQMQSDQKKDMQIVFGKMKGIGNLDYVSAWYKKASDYISNFSINCAFVSTNSITQGEQITLLWKPLIKDMGICINFAYQTFKWNSESFKKAAVHCVIIGFSNELGARKEKFLYQSGQKLPNKVKNINAYLLDAPTIFIENRTKPINGAPEIHYGSFALDDGNYTIKEKEYLEIQQRDPEATSFMRPFIGAQELMHNQRRYCVWLNGISPSKYAHNKTIMEKVKRVQEWRSKSNRENTLKLAATPTVFAEIRQPNQNYLAIPTVCNEKKRYLPMDYLGPEVIASNQIYVVENATPYHFGILMSNVHMAWVRAICGRLEMRYRYSSALVYNNFPWPNPTPEQQTKIEQTAQAILDARALYPDSNLADLYDPLIMPKELQIAHQKNDIAVMTAYGFTKDMDAYKSEDACVAELMKIYQKITT